MLQNIHQLPAARRASSVYCRWVQETHGAGISLVAVWMDPEMRCFQREFIPVSAAETPQDALEEPGGMAVLQFGDPLHN